MKANRRVVRGLRESDIAVSPVIAVILMVAVTVVLAGAVYAWIGGFGGSKTQAPNASFQFTGCDTASNTVSVKLVTASTTIHTGKLSVYVTAKSDGSNVGIGNWTASPGGTWISGTSQTYSGTSANLTTGSYTLNIVDQASTTEIGSIPFNC